MNKKGFTLVELLTVIIIISLLTLLVGTSVVKIVKKTKTDLSNTQLMSIKNSAELWGIDNIDLLPDENECKYLTLGFLKEQGLIDNNIIDPNSNENIDDNIKIKITNNQTMYGTPNIVYEVNPSNVNGCTETPYIKILTPTTGIKPALDENKDFIPGSEFKIKVNSTVGWLTFFVLSNDGNYVNLIAEQNITIDGNFTSEPQNGDEWYVTSQDNRYGPQTAYAYLSTATSNWTNIPVIENFSYLDEGNQSNSNYGYKSIITKLDETSGNYITTITPLSSSYGNPVIYKNMRARLPYYSEVTKNTSCTASYGLCPLWMVNYLRETDYYLTSKKINSIGTNNGYWLLSSIKGSEYYAYVVSYNGYTINHGIVTANSGIRPVITIKKSDLLSAM